MEEIRRVAYESVMRACGFGSLTIFCIMIGLSFNPKVAFQSGAFLTTVMAVILILKARWALTKDYRRTEMWLYLPEKSRPPKAHAQWITGTILRETFLTFALWTSAVAIVLWVLAVLFSLFGVESIY